MSLGRTGNNRIELLFTERINIKQAFKLGVAMILWDRQGLYVFFDRQDLESLVVSMQPSDHDCRFDTMSFCCTLIKLYLY